MIQELHKGGGEISSPDNVPYRTARVKLPRGNECCLPAKEGSLISTTKQSELPQRLPNWQSLLVLKNGNPPWFTFSFFLLLLIHHRHRSSFQTAQLSSHQDLPDQSIFFARQITLTRVVINTGKIFSNSLNSCHHPYNGSRRSSARGGASGSIHCH